MAHAAISERWCQIIKLMPSLLSHNDFKELLCIIATQLNDWNGVWYVVRDSQPSIVRLVMQHFQTSHQRLKLWYITNVPQLAVVYN